MIIDSEIVDVLTINENETVELANKDYYIYKSIMVEKGGKLIINNAKLYFDICQIYCLGTIIANNSAFDKNDKVEYWNSIIFSGNGINGSSFNNCTITNARGVYNTESKVIKGALIADGSLNESLIIKNTKFILCGSTDTENDLLGGAIYCDRINLEIENCEFICCSATYGGAIFSTKSKVKIINSKVEKCIAIKNGGAITIIESPSLMIENTNFSECHSTDSGAIFTSDSESILNKCIISKCKCLRTASAIMAVNNSKLKINLLTINDCKSDGLSTIMISSNSS